MGHNIVRLGSQFYFGTQRNRVIKIVMHPVSGDARSAVTRCTSIANFTMCYKVYFPNTQAKKPNLRTQKY